MKRLNQENVLLMIKRFVKIIYWFFVIGLMFPLIYILGKRHNRKHPNFSFIPIRHKFRMNILNIIVFLINLEIIFCLCILILPIVFYIGFVHQKEQSKSRLFAQFKSYLRTDKKSKVCSKL